MGSAEWLGQRYLMPPDESTVYVVPLEDLLAPQVIKEVASRHGQRIVAVTYDKVRASVCSCSDVAPDGHGGRV
jgi:hypothetical protein